MSGLRWSEPCLELLIHFGAAEHAEVRGAERNELMPLLEGEGTRGIFMAPEGAVDRNQPVTRYLVAQLVRGAGCDRETLHVARQGERNALICAPSKAVLPRPVCV